MKTKLRMHRTRYQAENTIEVVDSLTICEFGDEYLVTPGPRSGIERRSFHNLQDKDIKARADEVLTSQKRLLVLKLSLRLKV